MPMHPYPAPTRSNPTPQILCVDTVHGRAAILVIRTRLPRGYGCHWRLDWETGGPRTGVALSVEGAHEALEAALCAGPAGDRVIPSC